METELMLVQFRDAEGLEWVAAAELSSTMVPVGRKGKAVEFADLKAKGEVRVVSVKIVDR